MENISEEDRRKIEKELEILESRIAELRVAYEQHFSGYLPQPPTKQHEELQRYIRQLLNAPFKNTANRFKLNTLVNRFQLHSSQWEKVKREKEEGTYYRDVFKAKLLEKTLRLEQKAKSASGIAEASMKQLFNSYQSALLASGERIDKLDYDSFKSSLLKNAEKIKEKTGASKLKYQIVSVDGKVRIKTTKKD